MSSYILLLVFSSLGVYNGPKNFSVSEFSSRQSCEVALEEAKKFYKTVNSDSKCISVDKYIHKQKLKEELEEDDDDDKESV